MNAIARWLSWAAVVAAAAIGCQEPTLPDPNDPADTGEVDPSVMKRNLEDDYRFFAERAKRGEISNGQVDDLIAADADSMIGRIDSRHIPTSEAWQYGDVFRTARRWDLAKSAYAIAAKNAKNEDRRVNDTLHLAVSMAHLGDIGGAIAKARTVFDASPGGSAPILLSVLLELTPAAQGKGHDIELARLLEDAIRKHFETVVDPDIQSGKDFLMARSYHIEHAWEKIVELYREAGRDDLAEAALKRGIESQLRH